MAAASLRKASTATTSPGRGSRAGTSPAKDLMLRNVSAHAIKALKRAAIEVDEPMGRVVAGLVDEFLGLYVVLQRSPDDLTPEEAEHLRGAREAMARGEFVEWEDLKRELSIG